MVITQSFERNNCKKDSNFPRNTTTKQAIADGSVSLQYLFPPRRFDLKNYTNTTSRPLITSSKPWVPLEFSWTLSTRQRVHLTAFVSMCGRHCSVRGGMIRIMCNETRRAVESWRFLPFRYFVMRRPPRLSHLLSSLSSVGGAYAWYILTTMHAIKTYRKERGVFFLIGGMRVCSQTVIVTIVNWVSRWELNRIKKKSWTDRELQKESRKLKITVKNSNFGNRKQTVKVPKCFLVEFQFCMTYFFLHCFKLKVLKESASLDCLNYITRHSK